MAVRWNTSLRDLACASFGEKDCPQLRIFSTTLAAPGAECGVRSCAKSDPGSAQTKESRLRTRTQIALTSGIRQHGSLVCSKEGRKTLAVSQKNELRLPLKIPHILLIFSVSIDTVFTVIAGKLSECLPPQRQCPTGVRQLRTPVLLLRNPHERRRKRFNT
jgi:hypothetical protein